MDSRFTIRQQVNTAISGRPCLGAVEGLAIGAPAQLERLWIGEHGSLQADYRNQGTDELYRIEVEPGGYGADHASVVIDAMESRIAGMGSAWSLAELERRRAWLVALQDRVERSLVALVEEQARLEAKEAARLAEIKEGYPA